MTKGSRRRSQVDHRRGGYLDLPRPGVFVVAGEVRSRSIKRVASAVGESSTAVRFVHQYLAEMNAPQRSGAT